MIGKKWYTSALKIQPYVIMSILVIIAVVFAQDASWESGIKKLNTTAWGYIKVAVQSGLFLWFAIKVVMIFVQRDKETNWWGMLMLLGAIIIVQVLPAIYQAITGTAAINATVK